MRSDLCVVVGLGASGFSALKYLKKIKSNVAVVDTRKNPPHLDEIKKTFPDLPIFLGELDESLLAAANEIILSPGIPLSNPIITKQINRGAHVYGDIELFARVNKKPVLAITGTNAKSTVTTLVGQMASAQGLSVGVGGNLGIPALDLYLEASKPDLYVLELSSFQLETTHSLRARVATILNITPDHMDRYQSFEDYACAKQRIYKNCEFAVCNRDDANTNCHELPEEQKFYFTEKQPSKREFGFIQKEKQTYLAYESELLLNVREIPVAGKHYYSNALASLAIGYAHGFKVETMLNVLKTFKGLPHRCQFVRTLRGVSWYNDSKGTNVGASMAAILGLGADIQGKIILIAGGLGKRADFSPLLPAILKYVRHLVLIGEDAKVIKAQLGKNIKTTIVGTMADAVVSAMEHAEVDDCVLLSPACASFDMFKNFEHRGEVYMEIVNALQ